MEAPELQPADAASELRLGNAGMAIGRIGLAVLFLPLLCGLAALFLLDERGNVAIAVVLLALCLPFVWYALTTPLSVTVGDDVVIRYLTGRRVWRRDEIAAVRSGVIRTSFGPGRLLPWWHCHVRSIPTITLLPVGGRPITVAGDPPLADLLRRRLQTGSPSGADGAA